MINNTRFQLILFILSVSLIVPRQLFAEGYIGELITKALPDGRMLELVQPYGFEDSNGRQWGVPAGTVVDGASIPSIFWSLVGGPFSGKYRNASVIHDYYCDTKHRDWRSVHKVFHEAMLVSEVSEKKAKVMYYAVYRFGPRWEVIKWQPRCPPGLACMMAPGVGLAFKEVTLSFEEKDYDEYLAYISQESPSIEEIEAFANTQIERLNISLEEGPVTHKEFYEGYQDFPEDYEKLLDEWELRQVQRRKQSLNHE